MADEERDEEETEASEEEEHSPEEDDDDDVLDDILGDDEDDDEDSDEEDEGDDDDEESDDEDDADDSDEEDSDEDEESDDDEDSEDDEEPAEDDDDSDEADESDESDEDDSEPEASADDEDEEEEEAPRPKSKKKKRKGKGKGGTRGTAAARLAAARAAKAARKAAKRGKELKEEKDPLSTAKESDLGQRVQTAGDWAQQNRPTVYAIVAALVLGFGGWIGYYYYSQGQSQDAANALAAAVEIGQAEIVSEDAEPEEEPDGPTFTSAEERAEAALEAYDGVIADHGGASVVAWAHLGRGDALLALGRYEDARAAFDAAETSGGNDNVVVWRALEGKGFAFEAEESWDQALEAYQQLSTLADGAYAPVARYHTARMYIEQGETDQATETLSALVEELRGAEDDEDEQGFAYVLAQAEVRLRELDPSAVPARPNLGGGLGGGGGGPIQVGGGAPGDPSGQMSDEQLQELIRRFQEQQQQGGGGE